MLYLISSPIGNLNDISLRSIDVLKNADYIFAEDTRNTKKLLDFLDIKKDIRSLHEHNEQDITPRVISILKEGNAVAVISDAGTPAISDPGYFLLTECIKEEINFTALPGPSSVTNALLLSGMPPSSFTFLGFIPKKDKSKYEFLKRCGHEKHTLILFETAKRIEHTVNVLNDLYKEDIEIAICREMTKMHEEVIRGTPSQVIDRFNSNEITLKGEIVLVIKNNTTGSYALLDNNIKRAFLDKLPPKDAAKLISLFTKEAKREIYKSLLDL